MRRTGYIDEAYDDHVYVLSCVLDIGDAGQSCDTPQQVLRGLLGRGARAVHFSKESPKRRRQLAETYAALELPAHVFVAYGSDRAERRRGVALVEFAWLLADHVDELVFEARQEKLNHHDHAVLSTARRRPAAWRFEAAAECEMLWWADVVAGSVFQDVARGMPAYRAALGTNMLVYERGEPPVMP